MDSAQSRSDGLAPLPLLQPLARGTMLALVAVKLAIHLPLLARYGYFRDELYFLDCGRHLAWGYVDLAPLICLDERGCSSSSEARSRCCGSSPPSPAPPSSR